jgi:hypothetical protein
MKLIKLNNTGLYIIVDDYNTKEAYDSRITKGSVFYKDELKDICVAEYSPASKVSRPVIASINEYSNLGIKNSYGIPLINNEELNYHLEKYTSGIDSEILSKLCYYDTRNPDCIAEDDEIEEHKKSISKTGKCSCDNCFYGRTKLAEQIINNSDKKFTLDEINEILLCEFNKTKHTGEKVYHFYTDLKEIFSKHKEKNEWSVEIEMEYQKTESGLRKTDLPMIPKKDEQGYIKIIKIQ